MDEKKQKLKNAYGYFKASNVSIRSAAKAYSLPESTLRTAINNPSRLFSKAGRKCYFGPKEEQHLVNHCKNMANIGYGYSKSQILNIATNMSEAKNKKLFPTNEWLRGFLKRWPDLTMKNPKKRELSRVFATSKTTLSKYFEELDSVLTKYNMKNKPEQIWNIDESGISLDHTPPKIVAGKISKPFVVTSGRSEITTIIAAGSALGETIPPYVIFKGQRLTQQLVAGGLPGTKYVTSQPGWSNREIFLDFFENHFLKHVTVRPIIVMYDGHSTHISLDIIVRARVSNVHLFVIPPHSSHQLQPLDVGIFSPFKSALSKEFHEYTHSHPGRIVSRENLPQMIGKAYKSALTTSNLINAFRKTGIFPYNPYIIDVPETQPRKASKSASRKKRKNARAVKILFNNISEKTENDLHQTVRLKEENAKSYLIPKYGTAITEQTFVDAIKQKEQEKLTKKTTEVKSTIKQNANKRKNNTSVQSSKKEIIPKQSFKRKSTSNNKITSTKKAKTQRSMNTVSENPCPGPSKLNEWVTFYNSDDDSEVDESEPCCICKQFSPDGLRKTHNLEIVSWAKCNKCMGWVHLKFCSPVRPVGEGDNFICPKCDS